MVHIIKVSNVQTASEMGSEKHTSNVSKVHPSEAMGQWVSSTGTYVILVWTSARFVQETRESNQQSEGLPSGLNRKRSGDATAALGWLHAASTYASRRVGVDVAVLEVGCAHVDSDATSLPNTSKRENPMGAMGI